MCIYRLLTSDQFLADGSACTKAFRHLANEQDSNSIFFTCHHDNTMIGFRYVKFYRVVCELFQVYVAENHRHHGIAKRLLRNALNEAVARNCSVVNTYAGGESLLHLRLFLAYEAVINQEYRNINFNPMPTIAYLQNLHRAQPGL